MKLAIFGASKGIGHQLLRIAIEDGHEVTALLRTPNSLKISHPNLHIIKGDILSPPKLRMSLIIKMVSACALEYPPPESLLTYFLRV